METDSDHKAIITIREITEKGNSAEVKRDKNGNLIVYEVKKKKRIG